MTYRDTFFLSALVLVCVLASCRDDAQTGLFRDGSALYTVRPINKKNLVVTLTGRAENRNPRHHRAGISWIPIKWVRFDGETVSKGMPLIEFDTFMVDVNEAQKTNEKDVEDAQLSESRATTEQALSGLLLRKAKLAAEREVLIKQIEATRIKDEVQRGILVLQIEQARNDLKAAAHHLERVQSLASSGSFGRRQLKDAKDRHERARQALRTPTLQLEIHDTSTGAARRELLSLDLQALDIEFGNEVSRNGVFGEIESLSALQDLQEQVKTAKIRQLDWWLAKYAKMKSEPAIRAKDSGVLTYSPKTIYPIEVGSKHGAYSLAFVLKQRDLTVELFLPEKIRHLVRPCEEGSREFGRATIRFPALRDTIYRGTVKAIGSIAKESRDDGMRGFKCVVHVEDDLKAVRPGMTVVADIQIPVESRRLAVPLWFVTDVRKPEIVTEDGKRLPVRGYALGSLFILTEGVQDGAVIRMPGRPERDHMHRLAAQIEPVEQITVKWLLNGIGRHGRWIYRQLVPDGSAVEAGQLVAEAFPNWGDEGDGTYQMPFEKMDKDARLGIDRVKNQNRLISAYVAWRQCGLAADKARLNYLLKRYSSFDLEQTKAEVKQASAQLDLEKARQDADLALNDDSGFTSQHSKSRHLLNRQLAEIVYRKASLVNIAALRKRDWLQVWGEEENMESKLLVALAQRRAYSVAQLQYQLDMHYAVRRYRDFRRVYDRKMKDETCSKLYAPRSGRIFHREQWGEMPAVGEMVNHREAMVMPIGTNWQFVIDVPSRFYGRFTEGDTLSFSVPALDQEPREGVITLVSPYFEPSAKAFEDQLLRGSLGGNETIFRVRVKFKLSQDEMMSASPGLTAYVDL